MPTGIYNHSRRKTGRFQFCLICNKKFWVFKSEFSHRKFCSYKCYWKTIKLGYYPEYRKRMLGNKLGNALKGKPKSEIHRIKIREINKNRAKEINSRISNTLKKKYRLGILKIWNANLSKEIDIRVLKQAIKYSQKFEDPKFRAKRSGPNHPMWNGGSSFEPYPPEFNIILRRDIREQDNFTCQLCGLRESNLNSFFKVLTVHHIDYDKKNCKRNNLITLCHDCNIKVNRNRKFWTTFFQMKVALLHNSQSQLLLLPRV